MTQNTIFEKLACPMTVGMLIKAHRVIHDLTVVELEKKLKLGKGELVKIESGKTKLTLKETIKIAKKLEEYEDFYAMVWFQEEARDAGIDFKKYLKNQVD